MVVIIFQGLIFKYLIGQAAEMLPGAGLLGISGLRVLHLTRHLTASLHEAGQTHGVYSKTIRFVVTRYQS